MDIQKLKQELKQESKKDYMTEFKDRKVVYVGTDSKEHFKTVVDSNGNKVLDSNGKELKEIESSGYIYTFAELKTCKAVKVILSEKRNFELLNVYCVSGFGYDFKNSNSIYIKESGKVVNYG